MTGIEEENVPAPETGAPQEPQTTGWEKFAEIDPTLDGPEAVYTSYSSLRNEVAQRDARIAELSQKSPYSHQVAAEIDVLLGGLQEGQDPFDTALNYIRERNTDYVKLAETNPEDVALKAMGYNPGQISQEAKAHFLSQMGLPTRPIPENFDGGESDPEYLKAAELHKELYGLWKQNVANTHGKTLNSQRKVVEVAHETPAQRYEKMVPKFEAYKATAQSILEKGKQGYEVFGSTFVPESDAPIQAALSDPQAFVASLGLMDGDGVFNAEAIAKLAAMVHYGKPVVESRAVESKTEGGRSAENGILKAMHGSSPGGGTPGGGAPFDWKNANAHVSQ